MAAFKSGKTYHTRNFCLKSQDMSKFRLHCNHSMTIVTLTLRMQVLEPLLVMLTVGSTTSEWTEKWSLLGWTD